jgi:hypothetical protein
MSAIQSSKGYSWHAPAMKQHGIKVSTITENFTRTQDEETSKHRNYRFENPNRKKAPRHKTDIYYEVNQKFSLLMASNIFKCKKSILPVIIGNYFSISRNKFTRKFYRLRVSISIKFNPT